MNKKLLSLICLLPFLGGCRSSDQAPSVVSMQMVDRNGFAETISNSDRLNTYENVDFLSSQPYQKVLRVYKKDREGKSHSKLTNYHSNGGVWQYLEAIDGRANGSFLEWHENGKVKIEAHVIEGIADLNESAQKSWLFDKGCSVWDEEGNLTATFTYDKGKLEGEAKYYFPNGELEKRVFYTHGIANGTLTRYDKVGNLLEKIYYKNGQKEGTATAFWDPNTKKYEESYKDDKLITATYFDPSGSIVAQVAHSQGTRAIFNGDKLHSIVEYQNGKPGGETKIFCPDGTLHATYQVRDGKKNGEEWEYYPATGDKIAPKLMITWFDNQIQGMVKTWYKNSKLESQREMTNNKKHGLSLAYYESGDLMLMEEYENNRLLSGSYYKKGDKTPVSTVEKGDGVATLYTPEGHLLKKVTYEHNKPVVD